MEKIICLPSDISQWITDLKRETNIGKRMKWYQPSFPQREIMRK
jgi:hypothetical protein